MTDEKSTAGTLDKIREGAQNLSLMVRRRVPEAMEALDRGEFGKALEHLDEARSALLPLVHAQQQLGFAAGSYVARACDLEVGMKITGAGPIDAIDKDDHEQGRPVLITIGDTQLQFTGRQQLFVDRDDEPS